MRLPAEHASGHNPSVLTDILLVPFVAGDNRPTVYWAFVCERAYLLVSATSQVLLPSDGTVARFLVTILSLLCLGCFLLVWRPFAAPWKLIVKLYSLCLCAVAACLNLIESTGGATRIIEGMGVLIVAGSVGLFLVLVITFLADVTNTIPVALRSGVPSEEDASRVIADRIAEARLSVVTNPLLAQQIAHQQLMTEHEPLAGGHVPMHPLIPLPVDRRRASRASMVLLKPPVGPRIVQRASIVQASADRATPLHASDKLLQRRRSRASQVAFSPVRAHTNRKLG
jgi:hypothetical protein